MLYMVRIAAAIGLFLLIGIVTFSTCLNRKSNTYNLLPGQVSNRIINDLERNKFMNNKNKGSFNANDKLKIPMLVEWYKTTVISQEFAASMKDMWTIASDAYIPVEMHFLKEHPEVVGEEAYFKPFEPLFKQNIGNIDWTKAQEIMKSILKKHFIFDPKELPEHIIKMFGNDTCFFVTAKDTKTGKVIGFITFLMRANYPAGDIKIMSFAVDTMYQKRGVGKLLMSAIFSIFPEAKRLFLCTRVTNDVALNAYRSWGFDKDENPILDHGFNLNHWAFLEYKAEHSSILQEIAKKQ